MNFKRFALCVCGIMGAGCGSGEPSNEQTVEVADERSKLPSWEDYRDAASIGGGLYVVEWDFVFSSETSLREHYDELVQRVGEKLAVFSRISDGFEPTFPSPHTLDIVYCVSDTFVNKSIVVSDMAVATQAWQDAINVRFRYLPAGDSNCTENTSNVDFAVLPMSNTGLIGCGVNKMSWGSATGCPGSAPPPAVVHGVLAMDYSQLPSGALTAAGVFKHELGHVIGFRHEHPWAPGNGGCGETPDLPSFDITGRRLTAYDQASVMHYPHCGGLSGVDFALSVPDGQGARTIYGMPIGWYVPVLL